MKISILLLPESAGLSVGHLKTFYCFNLDCSCCHTEWTTIDVKCFYRRRCKNKNRWRDRRAQVGMERALTLSQRGNNQRGIDIFRSYLFSEALVISHKAPSVTDTVQYVCVWSLLFSFYMCVLSPVVFPLVLHHVFIWRMLSSWVLYLLCFGKRQCSVKPHLCRTAPEWQPCVSLFLKSENARNVIICGLNSDRQALSSLSVKQVELMKI